MKRTFDSNFIILGLISICVFVFYLFYVNLSIDTIILFLSNKIFLGKWLAQGVFPWFNPHIFLGTPFAFDIGLGNLHPFNLFFLLPYPYSFAVWMGATSFLFLVGFYRLFRQHTKTNQFALLLTLILFFSGTGIFRASNPTIYLVIAHFGLFAYSITKIGNGINRYWIFAVLLGSLMTLSGHFQFVLYGYIFILLYAALFSRKLLVRSALFIIVLGLFVAWFFIYSLPLISDSTRLIQSKEYSSVGNVHILQYLELILPYLFGFAQNGSKWGPGALYIIVAPLSFIVLLVITLWKNKLKYFVVLGTLCLASMGLLNFPFLRNAGQVIVLLHAIGLLFIAESEQQLIKTFIRHKYSRKVLWVLGLVLLCLAIILVSPLFTNFFIWSYTTIKSGKVNLFYDRETVTEMGKLAALSFAHVSFFITGLWYVVKNKKIDYIYLIFIVVEGIALVYFHCLFIPTSVIKQALRTTYSFQSAYRTQSAADLIPYFGIESYTGDAYFRPPFSKEKPVFDTKESQSYTYLTRLFQFSPTGWSTAIGLNSVQGYGTFMIKDLADVFKLPSDDFQMEYNNIIDANPLFAEKKQDTSVNSISSGHLTLNDPRWEKLGVRYFISDRPLKKYKLVEKNNGRYIYENEWAPPIYRVVNGDVMTAKRPTYQNPNEWHFDIRVTEKGSVFEMVMNPGGFVATINGKPVKVQKSTFLLRVPLTREGKLILRYSPTEHLKETFRKTLYSKL